MYYAKLAYRQTGRQAAKRSLHAINKTEFSTSILEKQKVEIPPYKGGQGDFFLTQMRLI
jgi:hypothetical protein